MSEKLARALALAMAAFLIAAFGVACGGSSGDATVTVTEPGGETTAEAEAVPTEPETESAESEASESGSEVLSGISTPSGSELLGSKEGANVVYEHYKTSKSPKEVESFYKEELSSAGWTIESSGGSSGGWGSWGGSDYGLTAKREDDYFDLEAGGEKNSDSYFEICAGPGSRSECEELSDDENDSSSGGSGSDDDSESESGGS